MPGTRRSGGSEADDPAALARGLGARSWSPLAEYKSDDTSARTSSETREVCAACARP